MAEQVFKSPGFFEREIEKKAVFTKPIINAIPVSVIGAADKGPAFVPTIVNSLAEFEEKFGKVNKNKLGGHAVAEYFAGKGNNQAALQFTRVLGIGNADGEKAGFEFKSNTAGDSKKYGGVQFLVAEHTVNDNEWFTTGMFINNTSSMTINFDGDKKVELVRGMFLLHKDCRLTLLNGSTESDNGFITSEPVLQLKMKSNSTAGILERKIKVSFDPTSPSYLSKALNTDPTMIETYGYVMYMDFPISKEVAEVKTANSNHVALIRQDETSANETFGLFNSKYTTPKTTKFISQPFGNIEYNLFHFESLDDGAHAAQKFKVSITNLRASTDVDYKYGTFNVEIRDLMDSDDSPVIIEQFTNVCLDPSANNYIAKMIGDQKFVYNTLVSSEEEKRVFLEGEFVNQSKYLRIVMDSDVKNGIIPPETLPFGFRGIPVLKTTVDGKDTNNNGNSLFGTTVSLSGSLETSILPPLPMRFKITKGTFASGSYLGDSNDASGGESVSPSLYWGLMNSNFDNLTKPNNMSVSDERFNQLVLNYTKFMGTTAVFSDSAADDFQNNKFSLSKVAFSKSSVSTIDSNRIVDTLKDAVYIRSAKIGTNQSAIDYKVDLSGFDIKGTNEITSRTTFASLLSEDKEKFNKYSNYTKFTAPMFGGFDGVNIFDFDTVNMNDWATSTDNDSDVVGKASLTGYESALDTYDSTGTGDTIQGAGLANNIVFAYKSAVDLVLDDATGVASVICLPGIKDPVITNHVMTKTRDYGRALYLMDIPSFATDGQRLYRASVDGIKKADVDVTISSFAARNIDNNYVATYFPDVVMVDKSDDLLRNPNNAANIRSIHLPSSIAALGALARSEGADTPWFAPAGFTKGALPNVTGVATRLKALDRDNLYEARINPIATFPGNEYVIFGQKTLQLANTALTRVNVRRLLVAIKRKIEIDAQALLFQQNTVTTRNRFKQSVESYLADVRIKQGIENFRVVINDDPQEADNNILSGKIIVVPTRVVEFIAMDFVVTNSGVTFA